MKAFNNHSSIHFRLWVGTRPSSPSSPSSHHILIISHDKQTSLLTSLRSEYREYSSVYYLSHNHFAAKPLWWRQYISHMGVERILWANDAIPCFCRQAKMPYTGCKIAHLFHKINTLANFVRRFVCCAYIGAFVLFVWFLVLSQTEHTYWTDEALSIHE